MQNQIIKETEQVDITIIKNGSECEYRDYAGGLFMNGNFLYLKDAYTGGNTMENGKGCCVDSDAIIQPVKTILKYPFKEVTDG